MKREFSLKGRKVFKEVFLRGKKVQGNGIQIFILLLDNDRCRKEENRKNVKIGIALNRKFGNAVQRNRIKRRIRAIFKMIIDELDKCFYIIVKPDNIFKEKSYSELKEELYRVLQKSGIVGK